MKNPKFNQFTQQKLNDVITEIETHIEFQAKVTIEYVEYIQQSNTNKHYYAKSEIKTNK